MLVYRAKISLFYIKCDPRVSGSGSLLLIPFCVFSVFLNACEIFCAFSWFLVLLLTNLLLPPRMAFFFWYFLLWFLLSLSCASSVFLALQLCVVFLLNSKEFPSVIFAHWYFFCSSMCAGGFGSREYMYEFSLVCWAFFSFAFSILADITQNISRSLHIFANLKNFISTFFSPMSTATKSWRIWCVRVELLSEKSICCCWFA